MTTAVAVLTLTGGVLAAAGGSGAPARVAAGPWIAAAGTNTTAASITRYGWTQLPPAPIAGRTFAASVWTGHEMLVWGGASASDALYHGAAPRSTPAKNTWRRLPPAPLSRRSQAVAVWTGHRDGRLGWARPRSARAGRRRRVRPVPRLVAHDRRVPARGPA